MILNDSNPTQPTIGSDEISLKDIILQGREWFRYLLSYWKLILTVGLVGGGIGFFVAHSQKPIYTATTTFVLEEGGGAGGLGQYAGMAAMVGIDIGGGGGGLFQGDNIIELYKSRTMLVNALLAPAANSDSNKLLIDEYLDYKKIRQSWKNPELRSLSFADSANFTTVHDSILSEIVMDIRSNVINVSKPDKKLSILAVSVKSPDEAFAKDFNDKLVSTVNNFYVETKTKKSLQNVKILQHQTDSVRAVMSGAIYSSVAAIDATPNLNPVRQVLRAPAQRSQFDAETNKAILTELVKNLELSKMAFLQETPLIQVVDKPIFPLSKDRASRLKGLIFGGFVAGFITIMVLIIRKIYRQILNG